MLNIKKLKANALLLINIIFQKVAIFYNSANKKVNFINRNLLKTIKLLQFVYYFLSLSFLNLQRKNKN